MKVLIQTILILLTITACQRPINLKIKETTETATVIKGNRFEGVIFSETMVLDTIYEKRFIPTVEEIELAESILRKQWKTIEPNKKFKDFSRQYAGVVDNEGNRILYMNFLYKKVSFFMCSSIIALPSPKLHIDKKALKNEWIFRKKYDSKVIGLGGFGTMTSVKIHLENKEVLAIENIFINAGFDTNGNPKPFPY
jgi:hypothetical protein